MKAGKLKNVSFFFETKSFVCVEALEECILLFNMNKKSMIFSMEKKNLNLTGYSYNLGDHLRI